MEVDSGSSTTNLPATSSEEASKGQKRKEPEDVAEYESKVRRLFHKCLIDSG